MKKIFMLLLTILVNIIINAQTKIESLDKKRERKQGVYYKDLDNELIPYVGIWKGQVKGQIFQITFERVKEYDEYNHHWEDRLYGKYEMRDKNGNLLYSTYSREIPKVFSLGFRQNKSILKFGFVDRCIEGDIYLKFTDSTKTKIEWEYEDIPQTIAVLEGETPNCAKVYEMPQEKFILVKQ